MTVDPDAAIVLEGIESAGVFNAAFDPVAFRGVFEAMVPQMWDTSSIELARVEDRDFPGADGAPLRMRIYTPHGASTPAPMLVFFHGGGFTSGSVDTADPHCRFLAAQAGVMVVNADYRLAPEHKHPAGFADCVAAIEWSHAHCATFGGDPERLAVGGDAPGATYALAAGLHFRDRGASPIRFQFLLGPATDWAGEYPQKQANFAIGPVSAAAVDTMRDLLISGPQDLTDWRLSPLRAQTLAGLPPTFILAGEYDFLTPEIDAFVAALLTAGIATTYQRWPGGTHNFFSMYDQIALARVAMHAAANVLRSHVALWR